MKAAAGGRAGRRQRSWSALRSGYHAVSGLLWVAPRTPSLKLGIGVVAALVAIGLVLRLSAIEIALIVVMGVMLLAVETLNTSIEMLCDALHPEVNPAIGKVKDVAAGATVLTEIGVALVVALVLVAHFWHWAPGT